MENEKRPWPFYGFKIRAKKQKWIQDLAKQIAEESHQKAVDALTGMLRDARLREFSTSTITGTGTPNFQNVYKKDYPITKFLEDTTDKEKTPDQAKEEHERRIKRLYDEIKAKVKGNQTEKPPYTLNFCRVFELPDSYPKGYCFNGGKPVTMLMVDWFNPWPDNPDLKTWDDVVKLLKPFLQNKNYVKPGKRYVLITDFGTSLVFAKEN